MGVQFFKGVAMNVSAEMKLELERRARETKDKDEHIRLCVILAKSEGMSIELIAQAHRISIQSVYRYVAEYQAEKKTKHDQRGGSQSKLTAEQTNELIEHIKNTTYLYAKHICSYVKMKYGIEYTVSGITFWLKEQGFVYKKPIKVPGKLDPEKQEAFIQTYEVLKESLKPDEEIFFMDAVHPEFQSKAVCGWIKSGEIKTLPTTSAQYRMHFIGALALEGMKVFAQEYEAVDADNMVTFFQALESFSSAKVIHVICDNGRSNKNKKIEEYLKTSRIKVHYLPPYSPNLNPIERLWKVLREKKTYNKYYEKFADFKKEINQFFFEEIPKIKNELASRITDKFQRIRLNTMRVATV
jgi:transposase